MKSLITVILCALIANFCSAATTTYTATEGGRTWSYTLDSSGNATLTAVNDATGELMLPSSLDGHTVTGVGASSFQDLTGLDKLTVPNSITWIGGGAFAGSGIRELVLGNGVRQIYGYSYSSIDTSGDDGYADHGAFGNCTQLANIVFGTSLTNIGNQCFAQCTSLKSLTLPDTVQTIGVQGFYGCTSLTDLHLGKGLVKLNERAFSKCTALKTATFSDGASPLTICESAFNGCSLLESVLLPNNLKTFGCSAFANTPKLICIDIPDSVVSISGGAFAGSGIRELVLGDGVRHIYGYSYSSVDTSGDDGYAEHGAFGNCTQLTNVIFGASLTNIGNQCFAQCTSLKSLTLPDTVQTIGVQGFYGCTALGDLHLGKGLVKLNERAFSKCTALKAATFSDGGSPLTICESAFNGCSLLESVRLPNNLKTFGCSAFANTPKLIRIDIPDSVTGISGGAFSGSGIRELALGNAVRQIYGYSYSSVDTSGDDGYAEHGAFGNCTQLTNIIFGASLTNIGNQCFAQCTSLKSLTIPDTVQTIGVQGFYGCTSLTELRLGKGLVKLNERAFSKCTALKDVVFQDGTSPLTICESSFNGCSLLETVRLPNNLKTFGCYTFANTPKLVRIDIPDSVASISGGAFSGSGIRELVLGDGVRQIYGYSYSSVDTSGEDGYAEYGAFGNCTRLTNIVFGASLTNIGNQCFAQCTALRSLTVPDTIQTIGVQGFYGCTSLPDLHLGKGLVRLNERAFSKCTALTTIIFSDGDSPLTICESAFNGCSLLETVRLPNNLKTFGCYAFANTPKLVRIDIPDSVISISGGAFAESGIRELVLGNAVRQIYGYSYTSVDTSGVDGYAEYGAFGNCAQLTNIVFGASLTNIGNQCFAECTSLKAVTIPDTVQTIGVQCFYGCTSLTKITIGNGVTSIGKYAFGKCPALRSLNIGAGVTSIGEGAFSGVSDLRYVYFHGLTPPTLGSKVFSDAPSSMIVYVADGGTGWNSEGDGLPATWNGFTIKWGSSYSPSAEAPYDLTFAKPAGWPASAFLTSTPTGLVAETRFLAGDTIYLRYAFRDAWADENIITPFTNGVCVTDGAQTVLDLMNPMSDGCAIGSTVLRTVQIEGLGISDDYRLDLKLDDGGCIAETDEDNNTNSCAFAVVPSVAVTFVSDDNEYAVVRYLQGGTFDPLPTAPTRWGFDFLGWYTAEEGGNLVVSGSHVPNEPTTLYARWSIHISETIEFSGTISADTTWTFGNLYKLTGSVTVKNGATLTIEPGVVVKFPGNSGLTVSSGARLVATGTRGNPIVFTSLNDDSAGGKTDGSNSNPQGGDWRYIDVAGTANLEYCNLSYGGPSNERGLIQTSGGTLTMDSCTISHSKYDGVWNWNGSITVRNSVITDVGLAAAPYRGTKNEYDNCVFYGCQYVLMYWSHWSGKPVFSNCIFVDMSMGWTDTNSQTLQFRDGCTFKNCCFWNEPGVGLQSCSKSTCLYADPLFLDPENGNFRIAANSPCIDAGLGEYAPEKDYYGQPRMEVDGIRKSGTVAANGKVPDIGLYEVPGGTDVPAADLVVTAVTAPAELSVGGTAKVSWTVANNGDYEALAGWRDAIELVTANGQTVLLGTFMGDVDLASGKTANFSTTVTIPSALEGACTVRVTANKYRDVFECYAYDNNATDAEPSVLTLGAVTLPTTGDPYALALAASGETAFRLGNATEHSSVIVIRSAGEISAWLGNGAVATKDNAIRSAVQIADDTWLLQVAANEEPRVSVANDGESAATCELSLEEGDFFLLATDKTTAGNGGTASLAFYGNGFDETISCYLTQGATRRDAQSVKVDGAVSATAVFDLTDVPAGDYVLHVKKGGDEATATLLTVTQTKIGAKWNCKVDIASTIRPERVYVGTLSYANEGDTAMDAPYVRLTAGDGTLIRLSEADAWGTSIELMATSDTYPAHTLKPGESSRLSFFYKTSGEAAEITYAYTLASDEAFPWTEAKTEMKPASVTDVAWNHAFRTLRANLGETWNDYLDRMRSDCDHLMEIGSPVKRLDRIWQLEIADALGTDAAMPTLVSATDLSRSARGLGLSFVRTYSSSMSKRFNCGNLGYGWTDNYSTYAELQDDETLVFHLPSGGSYSFTKASGSWQPEDARDKSVLTETDAAYVLTYASGTVQTFSKSNMRTATIADNQGNTLTFTYAAIGSAPRADRVTRVSHSDGQYLTFNYSGEKLVSATDDQGRTTTYGYDGDLLTSVTAYNGLVTRYAYAAASGTPNDYALTKITYADGTTKEFTYDEKGLLATASVNGGQQTTEIVRGKLGSYTIVAPNGGETSVTVGANGETLKTVNALGEIVKQVYTDDSLLEATIAPSGKRNKVTYDKQGSPIASMSASGATTTFAYTSEFDNLASVTDAKGHAFTYGYDEKGRSTSVGYADGSASTLEYNKKGDVAKSTNRRGESVTYAYDDEGNLIRKTWDNGRTFALAYDEKGNVTNATDSVTGAVTMEYDANERLVKIVYPKNRGFTFKYDAAGRQIERAALDGVRECYEYDAFGRLARVTDGAKAYLTNAYDPATGWLVTQAYGNGTVVSNAYDLLGRTIGIYHLKNGNRLAFFEYAYDIDGKCISQTTAEGVERYTYDADGQLTAVTYPDGTSESFAYDAVGNRTTANDVSYTVNELNQYTAISDGTTLAYDCDGNLISRTDANGTTTYAYDTLNRLIAVTNAAKNIRWSCEYDVFGNRVSVTDNGTTTEKVYVQGSLASVAAEYVDGTRTKRHVVIGAVRLADIESGSTRYYHADLLGSTRLTTDAAGAQQSAASYKAFGTIRKSTGTQTDAGYVGTLGIETDANGFLFMRNRYYDADMGRFVQMDPIGLNGGDQNVYSYVMNKPVSTCDANGMLDEETAGRMKDVGLSIAESGVPKAGLHVVDRMYGDGIHHIRALGGGGLQLTIKETRVADRIVGGTKVVGGVAKYAGAYFSGEDIGYKIGEGDYVGAAKSAGKTALAYNPLTAKYVLAWDIGNLLGEGLFYLLHRDSIKAQERRMAEVNAKLRNLKSEKTTSESVQSCDPNEITGPSGTGEARYVLQGEWMNYTIYFENKTNATAAAQEITVTLPMDPGLDWSTLELGEVAFGDNIDMGLNGKRHGTSSYALPGTNTSVVTTVSTVNGTNLVWYLRSYDPTTLDNFPEDPRGGFLPPNNTETHCGEGRLSYRVKVADATPNGTIIAASADIQFDTNEHIETDPSWWNTVGVDTPMVAFAESEIATDEGSNLVVTISGGNADKAASAQVYLSYQTAAAADIDLKTATVDGVTPKGGIKFPLTLSWVAGCVTNHVISILVKTDKTVEDDETLVFQLAAAQGQELGEVTTCAVTIRDANVAADYAAKQAKETVKVKKGVETNALAVACVAGEGSGTVCGYTTGQGRYSAGSKATLKATARPGWEFKGWGAVVEGVTNVVSDKASWSVTLTNDAEIVALFGRIPYVAGLASPADGGKVAGSGYCAAGKKVTLKATANKNYTFTGWYTNDVLVSSLASLVLDRSAKPAKSDAKQTVITNVSESVTYYATFKSDPTVYVYLTADDSATAPGKVTGAGKYAAGKKKIALKATANKGYVFRGWYEGAVSACGEAGVLALPDPVSRLASYMIAEMPTNDVELTAMFITSGLDKSNIVATVNGMAFETTVGGGTPTLPTNIWTGVYLEWPVAASALSETTVKVAGLPSGLKFTAKDVTQKIGSGKTAQTVVVVPANTIYGAPSAASKIAKDKKTGTVSVTPSAVKITVTTAGKSSQTYQINTTVDPLPAWAQGTFTGPSYSDAIETIASTGAGDGAYTNGTVSVTIGANGKISAKQPVNGKSTSFAASYFDSYAETDDFGHAFFATLTAKVGKEVVTNEMVVCGMEMTVGDGTPTLPDMVVTNGYIEADLFDAWQYNWKVEPWKTLIKPHDKKTTAYVIKSDGSFSESEEDLSLSLGADIAGRVTLKFAASGAVTASGEFVSGYDYKKAKYTTVKATGSATLVPSGDGDGLVFVYLSPKGLSVHTRCVTIPLTGE